MCGAANTPLSGTLAAVTLRDSLSGISACPYNASMMNRKMFAIHSSNWRKLSVTTGEFRGSALKPNAPNAGLVAAKYARSALSDAERQVQVSQPTRDMAVRCV